LNFHQNFGLKNLSLHVDRLRCCRLRWTVSVIYWWRTEGRWSPVYITLTVDICVDVGREAPRRAGLSAAAGTYITRQHNTTMHNAMPPLSFPILGHRYSRCTKRQRDREVTVYRWSSL